MPVTDKVTDLPINNFIGDRIGGFIKKLPDRAKGGVAHLPLYNFVSDTKIRKIAIRTGRYSISDYLKKKYKLNCIDNDFFSKLDYYANNS